MRFLILHRPGDVLGGDLTSAANFAEALRNQGHEVELRSATDFQDDYREFVLTVLWSAQDPDWGLPAAMRVNQHGGRLAVVPSWGDRTKLQRYLNQPGIDVTPGYTIRVARTLQEASALFVATMHEAEQCWKLVPGKPVFKMGRGWTPLPIQPRPAEPYVSCLARIEPHKNQLTLAKACKELSVELRCVGPLSHQVYAKMVDAEGAILLGELPHNEALEVLARSRVHALPSFGERGGNSHIEAATLAVPGILGWDSGEPEFFGDLGIYVDPINLDQLKQAIIEAWHRPRFQWAAVPSWDQIAQATLRWMELRLT